MDLLRIVLLISLMCISIAGVVLAIQMYKDTIKMSKASRALNNAIEELLLEWANDLKMEDKIRHEKNNIKNKTCSSD